VSELPHPLTKLRESFPAHQISKLPKETKTQIDQRKADRSTAFKCDICGGWHHKQAVHLDYVGHAALTDRLLDTDMEWSWEPLSFNQDGLPAFDRANGLWIKLTVLGVTRLGYGAADGKSGGDAIKEIIGDALRNAAMRFGAALDLWHKGDLHLEGDDDQKPSQASQGAAQDDYSDAGYIGPKGGKMKLKARADAFYRDLMGCGDQDMLAALLGQDETEDLRKQLEQEWIGYLNGRGMSPDFEAIYPLVKRLQKELPEADGGERFDNPLGAG